LGSERWDLTIKLTGRAPNHFAHEVGRLPTFMVWGTTQRILILLSPRVPRTTRECPLEFVIQTGDDG
jgi:hypothetical protein